MECERLEKCPFFQEKMPNMPATAEIMKKNYCKTDPSKCARYIVFKALGQVPIDLWPYEIERAKEIIKEGKF